VPVKPGLRGYRMIMEWPPYDKQGEFTEDVKHELPDVDDETARALWELICKYGRKSRVGGIVYRAYARSSDSSDITGCSAHCRPLLLTVSNYSANLTGVMDADFQR
jgi:hypothetical protein